MRIGAKGQVTIPLEIRQRLGLLPDTEVEFKVNGEAVSIKKAGKQGARGDRVRAWAERVRGSANSRMSTDEIMKLTRGE